MCPTDKCSHCGSSDLAKGVLAGRTADVLTKVGLLYRTLLVLNDAEQLYADVCKACGTVTRFYVKETDRPWLT